MSSSYSNRVGSFSTSDHTPRLRRREMGDLGGDHVAGNSIANAPPSAATDAVLVLSEAVPAGAIKVNGVDFDQHDKDITVVELVKSMATMGFQATAISDAVRIVNKMRSWRDAETGEPATIFLGYTSNLISSGLRETLRFLVQHKHVSAIVTTAGGVEEDLIKCLGHTYLGSFTDQGAALRAKGMNRIGNMIVPNSNYCAFEDWVVPILDKMLEEQEEAKGTDHEFSWTPSKITARLGKEINDKSSVLYWAYKNDIPIFSPALTDGSLGDMMYFRTFKHSPQQLRFDPIEDLRRLNTMAVRAKHAGMIIVGGGLVKHHIANACLMRNGADEAVFINTSQEFDGSDAGARPDEAVSWGKIKATADTVKVSSTSANHHVANTLRFMLKQPSPFR
jgi:deoxyhypusine synthase